MSNARIKKGDGFCHGRFDLLQRRRLEQEQRYALRRQQVRHLLAGEWRLLDLPCKCGRNHYGVQSRSGLGTHEHCPQVLWGKAMLAGPMLGLGVDFTLDWRDMTKRIFDQLPDNISAEELDRWYTAMRERGEAALAELDELSPELAKLIRELSLRKTQEAARVLWPRDDDIL